MVSLPSSDDIGTLLILSFILPVFNPSLQSQKYCVHRRLSPSRPPRSPESYPSIYLDLKCSIDLEGTNMREGSDSIHQITLQSDQTSLHKLVLLREHEVPNRICFLLATKCDWTACVSPRSSQKISTSYLGRSSLVCLDMMDHSRGGSCGF